ncbi:SH3 domain-containing protein [Streptomyces sp. NPDC048270]|uniref:SH3 domain-containing protein n=1 Tax=Streptomyces sp. NPDC048270 TaxID=3154615 RepID=UPI0033E097FA
MLKPTRTILALAAGSLVLGLVGAGTAVADEQPMAEASSQSAAAGLRHSIGKVVSRGALKVRSRPTTRSQAVGHVYPNRTVEIECKQYGESVDGNRLWYRLYDRNGSEENGPNENGSDQNGNNGNGNPGNGNPGNGNGNNGNGNPGNGNNGNGNPGNGNGNNGNGNPGNGNGNNGNGNPGNGNTGNGTWPGSGNPNAGSSTSNKAAYDHERWVAARYVQNLGTVRFCR